MTIKSYYMKARDIADRSGISISELCKRAGIARATVTRWKKGETQPSMRTWEKIENATKKKD